MTHSQRWLKSLMVGLDSQVDEDARIKILENCGRSCISRSFIKRAKALKTKSKDADEFLERLSREWKHLQLDGDKIRVRYEKCYCPMVSGYSGELSPTFCNCSRGWIKELFESVLGKPVVVELEKSIKRGDSLCQFEIRL